jgi:hypothetical protein
MMDIVTGCSGESPLGFRANPQIRGAVRRPCRRTTASKHNGIAQSKTLATRRRRIHAEYAVITAVISTASSMVPVTTWLRSEWAHAAASEPMHQVTAGMQNGAHCANDWWAPPATLSVIATPAARQKSAAGGGFAVEHHGQGQLESSEPGTVLTALIRPAPSGEITPDPPQVPAPTVKPIAPSVAAPPPQAEQPLSPPRQPVAPPPQPEAPAPQPEAPAPQPLAPAPQQEGPSPQPEPPPSEPPPRGHVQLAP